MNRLLTSLVAAAALWIAACSNGGSAITPPPPTGKYSTSSLNGTYAFVTTGEAITSGATAATPFSRTGSFTANGSGVIQGGVYDLVNQGGSSTASSAPIPITGGSYTVNADGRGTLTFNVTSNGAPATLAFGIVLTSTSSGFMMDQTASGNQASTGSGNFVLQNSAAFAAGVSGSYVFDFTGLDGSTNPGAAVSGGTVCRQRRGHHFRARRRERRRYPDQQRQHHRKLRCGRREHRCRPRRSHDRGPDLCLLHCGLDACEVP